MIDKKQYKLSELYEIKIGGTPSRNIKEYWDNGVHPWVSIRDISKSGKFLNYTKEKITKLGASKSNVKLLKKGTLIMSFKLSIGKMAWAGKDLYTNEAICGFINKDSSVIIDEYLHVILSNYNFNDSSEVAIKGVTLNKDKLENLIIDVPVSLSEQKRIAKILTCVDNNIDITEQEIKKLEQIKMGMMNELFNKGIGHDKFQDSEFGVIPYNWRIDFLGNLDIKIIDGDRGENYPKESDYLTQGFCLFLNAKNVTNDGFVFDKKKFISEDKDKELRSGKLKYNDLVLTTRGTVGNLVHYNETVNFKNVRINSGMLIIRNYDDLIDTIYLKNILREKILPLYISKISGSVIKQLPSNEIKKFNIFIPDKDEQLKINEIIEYFYAKIQILKQKKQKLEQLKKGLLNDLL